MTGPALALILALSAAAPAPAQSAVEPAATPVALMTGPSTLQMLEQTVEWYRTLGVQQQAANDASDLLIL